MGYDDQMGLAMTRWATAKAIEMTRSLLEMGMPSIVGKGRLKEKQKKTKKVMLYYAVSEVLINFWNEGNKIKYTWYLCFKK